MAVIDNLRLQKEQVEATISAYESRKMAMENTYLKISNEVRTLDTTWNGEASEKFKASFEAMYKNLSQTETAMDDIISKLKAALATYEANEETVKALFNNMDTGTGFQTMA